MFDQLKHIDSELLLWINNHNSPFLNSVMWQFSKMTPTVL